MNLDLLKEELKRDEAVRYTAYDDATSLPIKPGMLVRGNVTIGVGRAVNLNPLDDVEVAFLLDRTVTKILAALPQALPWFQTLDDVRQRVLVNMAFQMGVHGLLEFRDTLGHVQRGEYPQAAIAMEESRWFKQTGVRAARLAKMMRTGGTQ